ncbi:serine hydrolase domain-containing protein [Chachezhania sediminis]|uniref:serine hydrolase domain-containing protein n=1 Tax=Chachezhania sediminis TaxID=2599291 RepID=UPI001E61D7FA|nr:serine hydrolase domain-containing protein [Chachezhania sediminis]
MSALMVSTADMVVAQACVADPAAVTAYPVTAAMTTTPLPDAMASKLDAAVRASLGQAAAPGIIAGVLTPDGYWTGAWGVADPDTGAPMEVGMHTRIGSVTKTFTVTSLLQLVEEGKVSLEDTIDQYVDGVPNGDRVTLRQLANMTSGVLSYTASEEFFMRYLEQPGLVYTPEDLLGFALPGSPIFEPGAEYDYSNTNTILLGLVIEKVTGQSIADVFADRIFQPLGMDNTSWPGTSTEMPEPFPQGITLQGNADASAAPVVTTHWNPSGLGAAGALISNMGDLMTYGRAYGTGQGLLKPETQEIRLTSFAEPAGYGLGMRCAEGWVGHTGDLPGFNTAVFYDTESDFTVVVQANSDIKSGDCSGAPVLPDNPTGISCALPARRVFGAIAEALGRGFSGPLPR